MFCLFLGPFYHWNRLGEAEVLFLRLSLTLLKSCVFFQTFQRWSVQTKLSVSSLLLLFLFFFSTETLHCKACKLSLALEIQPPVKMQHLPSYSAVGQRRGISDAVLFNLCM